MKEKALCVFCLSVSFCKKKLIISRDGTNLGKSLEERDIPLREQEGQDGQLLCRRGRVWANGWLV